MSSWPSAATLECVHSPGAAHSSSPEGRVARLALSRAFLTAVLVAMGSLGADVAAQVPEPDSTCPLWSPAHQVWTSPLEVGLLSPMDGISLLAGEEETFVVSTFWEREPLPGDPAREVMVYRIGERGLTTPPGGRFYIDARGALGPDGRLHVLWGEPEPGFPPDSFQPDPKLNMTRIMYASYEEGGWTETELVYQATPEDWIFGFPLIVDRAGVPHTVVSGTFPMSYLRRGSRGWRGPGAIPGKSGLYASLVLGPGSRRSLGFVAAAGPGQRNSVFFRRSEDGGKSWEEPILVHLSGGKPAMKLRLVRSRGDTLHLLWVITPAPNNPVPEAIAHATSADGGRTWSEPRPVPMPARGEGLAWLVPQVDPDGVLHLTFLAPAMSPHQLLWHTWVEEGRMRDPELLLPDTVRRAGKFDFVIDGRGRQHLLWAHAEPWRESDPPGYRDLRVSYAVRPPCGPD